MYQGKQHCLTLANINGFAVTSLAVRRRMLEAVLARYVFPVSSEFSPWWSLRPISLTTSADRCGDEFVLPEPSVSLDLIFVVCFVDCHFHN